jgi:hypothetical protein
LPEAAGLDEARLQPQQFRQHVAVRPTQGFELRQAPLRAAIARRTERIDHRGAGNRARGRRVAQNDAVACQGAHLVLEHELRQRGLARHQPVALEQRHTAHDMGRADMDMDRGPVLERLAFRREQSEPHVGPVGRRVQLGAHHPVAAPDRVLRQPRTCEVERAAFAGAADLGGAVLRMQAAHARLQPRGRQQQPIVDPDLAGMNGAGYHNASARQHEAAVDRQSGKPGDAFAAFTQR